MSKLFKQKFLRKVANRPNVLIVICSLVIAFLLFCIALTQQGVWQDFVVNLSASSLVVGATVIFVDMLRERHLSKQYAIPKSFAYQKILGANSTLALDLAIKTRASDPTALQGILQHIQANQSASDVIATGGEIAIRRLAKLSADKLVAGYSNEQLKNDLKPKLQQIYDIYASVEGRYGFSFNDITLRSDYAQLLDKVESVIQTVGVAEVNSSELEKLFKPVDPSKPGEPMTAKLLVGIMLKGYIEDYIKFIDNHGLIKNNKPT